MSIGGQRPKPNRIERASRIADERKKSERAIEREREREREKEREREGER